MQALAQDDGPLQLSLFDDRDLAEISAPDLFPGERLIVCRNHDLATERARMRENLLIATERELDRIEAQVRRKSAALRDAAGIGLAGLGRAPKQQSLFKCQVNQSAATTLSSLTAR